MTFFFNSSLYDIRKRVSADKSVKPGHILSNTYTNLLFFYQDIRVERIIKLTPTNHSNKINKQIKLSTKVNHKKKKSEQNNKQNGQYK